MHKNIKRFGHEGQVADDAAFPRLREYYEKLTVQDMRADGYVPVIGLGPFWATSYNSEKDLYEFKISVFGIYVGRKKSCLIDGITVEARTIMFPNKSNPSSTQSE